MNSNKGSTPNQESQISPKSNALSIRLGQSAELNLEGLSEIQIRELKMEHARGIIRVSQKAAELGVEATAFQEGLKTMSSETVNASRDGTAVTMTRTTNDSMGRTEVIMGNTETAQRGKLSRSQTGEKDYTLYYLGAVVLIIVVWLLAK